jgi:hypothetical protein
MVDIGTAVATVGVGAVILYVVINLLKFYGLGFEVFAVYVYFFGFLLLSSLFLPKKYVKLFNNDDT